MIMNSAVFPCAIAFFSTSLLISCTHDESTSEPPVPPGPDIQNTFGHGVLAKVKGIWNGPVTSSTPLGGYPEWIVDFRPIAENWISAKNELDTLNDINMSFFIALYDGEYKVAFRNGGSFAGFKRISYFLADSVSETADQAFYRFSEIRIGAARAYADLRFHADSMVMRTYTNHYNMHPTTTWHMTWKAQLQDSTSAAATTAHFDFPKKTLTKDFTTTFNGATEAVYYDLASDPFPESDQPYLGQATINYSYAGGFVPDPLRNALLIITTQPLINGFVPDLANLKYRSRYVILSAIDQSFTFNNMHPGDYYLYALYDDDGNFAFSSGDRVSATNTAFTLTDHGTVNAATAIDFQIP